MNEPPKTSHTLTLSRWHKVAERLSREYTEAVYACRLTLNQTKVSAYLGETQERQLREQSTMGLERLNKAFVIQDSLAQIRQVLGDANVHHGISAKLAEFDKLNRRVKVLTEIMEGQTADMIGIDELHKIPADYVADGERYDSKRPLLNIRMLDANALGVVRTQFEQTRTQAYALADEIADLNRAKITLELPLEIAQMAGL